MGQHAPFITPRKTGRPILSSSRRAWSLWGRPLTPASTKSTGSFGTAFAHTPFVVGGMDHHVAEADLAGQRGGPMPACIPQRTENETRHAATITSTDGSACWPYLTQGYTIYACIFLALVQQESIAYGNYRYQMQLSPRMGSLLQRSASEIRNPRRGDPNRSADGFGFAPRRGGYRHLELDQHDRRNARRTDTRYNLRDGTSDRGHPQLPLGAQDAISYLQNSAGEPNSLPMERRNGEPVPPVPQSLQHPDVEIQTCEVSEHFAEDAGSQAMRRVCPFEQMRKNTIANGSRDFKSDSFGSSETRKDG